jgi:hypothetical protein
MYERVQAQVLFPSFEILVPVGDFPILPPFQVPERQQETLRSGAAIFRTTVLLGRFQV